MMPNLNPAELSDFVKQIFVGAGAEPDTYWVGSIDEVLIYDRAIDL